MNSPLIFSRVDIYRNIQGHAFLPKLSRGQALDLEEKILAGLSPTKRARVKRLRDLARTDQEKLYESLQVSRKLLDRADIASFIVEGQTSLFLFEEEHVRISSCREGLALREACQEAYEWEEDLDQTLDFAFDPDFGYLNSQVLANGNGWKLSVIIHLKGFKDAGLLDSLSQSMLGLGFQMKPFEPLQGLDIYEISYAKNLGYSEKEALERFIPAVERIYQNEKDLRRAVLEANPDRVKDQYYRSIGTLIYGQVIGQEEVEEMLSQLLYGYSFGLEEISFEKIKQIFEMSQKFHMIEYKNNHQEMRSLDILRGDRIRDYLLKEVSYGK